MNRNRDNQSKDARVSLSIAGAVQGVGFRPFVFRLAQELKLAGFVCNNPSGVVIEAEGDAKSLKTFIERIPKEKPAPSFIQSYQYCFLDPVGFDSFQIRESDTAASKSAVVLPDVATCPECLQEVFDLANRRYLYPFTNCTHCGPRYSIIEALPYDRASTSMKPFTMCSKCRKEYEDPSDRRFHAQPNACPICGPQVELWDVDGRAVHSQLGPVAAVAVALKEGKIVAVKGIGGFHLLVDAGNEEAVRLLRERKHREEKPFAVMFPSLKSIETCCEVAPEEKALLTSGESPIVLLKKKDEGQKDIASLVAPNNPCLGAMLAYSPLHHILLKIFGKPVVATSANLSEEPICTDEREAVERLSGIADWFLIHNRPIVRSLDDSVVRVLMERVLVLRRARGYAPLPVSTEKEGEVILATGGHLKNTVALNIGKSVFVSQHIGDLQSQPSLSAFQKAAESLKGLYESSPAKIACDLHPDYLSTKFARETNLPVVAVQHHHAHVVSCMAENRIDGTVLGVAFDGAGCGDDGTVWGGEFLKSDLKKYRRVAHLRPFRLPGGDKAAVEPRRVAASVLYELSKGNLQEYSDLASLKAFSSAELSVLKGMLDKNINAPVTSSAGRLFDAVASLLDLKQALRFEGQAAMSLEYIIEDTQTKKHYPFSVEGAGGSIRVLDWAPMFREIIKDVRNGLEKPVIAAKFHNTLVEMVVAVAKEIGEKRVVLSGGCFQNCYLTENTVTRLTRQGFKVYWHQLIPPNDGGISLGQAVSAACRSL